MTGLGRLPRRPWRLSAQLIAAMTAVVSLSVVIMIFGISLFLRLVQVIFRPRKVEFPCPTCGLRRHDPELDAGTLEKRLSNGGRYLSVTVTFTAQSREHLDAIYAELKGHERVLYLI